MVVKKKRGRPRKRPDTDKKLKQKQKQKQQVVVNVSGGGGGGFIPAAPTQTPTFDYSLLANLIRPAATTSVPIAAQPVAEAPFVRPSMEEPLAASKPKMEATPKKLIDPQGAQPEFFEGGTFQEVALDKEPISPMMTEFGARKAEGKPLFETPTETDIYDLRKFTEPFSKKILEETPSGTEFIMREKEASTSKKPAGSSAPSQATIDKVQARLKKYDEDIKNASNVEAGKKEIKKREAYLARANEAYGKFGVTFT
jgi:hypothetical protein